MQDHPNTTPLSVSPPGDICPASSLGASFNPFSEQHLANPFPFFAQARKSEPVFFSPMLGAWVISRYDDIKAILHDPKRFSSIGTTTIGNGFTPAALAILKQGSHTHTLNHAIISVDPPQHTRLRAILTKTFSAQKLAKHEPLVRRIASQLIDRFRDEGQVDILERFHYPFPTLMIFHLLGIPEADLEQVHTWSKDWAALRFSRLSAQRQVECAHSTVAFQRYVDALIEQRRAAPQHDLISDLLAATNDGEMSLSQEELFAQLFFLILAGSETSAAFLGNCLLYLLDHRSLWQRICDDPQVIPGVVEEALRLDSSVPCYFRTTTEEVEIGGVSLPAGARVLMLWASANRDETQFPNPEAFLLQRPNQTRHMGFGGGIHFCLGASLARMEARIALELLSTHLPSLRLVPDQELTYKPIVIARDLTRLLVEWDVR